MVPGYVQAGTRPPPDHPRGLLWVSLYSCNLSDSAVLAANGGYNGALLLQLNPPGW